MILKAQKAQRTDALQVSACLVEPVHNGWQAIVDLWDGVAPPNGRTERIVMSSGTQEEAIAAIEKVQSEHAPVGYKAKQRRSTIIIGDVLD